MLNFRNGHLLNWKWLFQFLQENRKSKEYKPFYTWILYTQKYFGNTKNEQKRQKDKMNLSESSLFILSSILDVLNFFVCTNVIVESTQNKLICAFYQNKRKNFFANTKKFAKWIDQRYLRCYT